MAFILYNVQNTPLYQAQNPLNDRKNITVNPAHFEDKLSQVESGNCFEQFHNRQRDQLLKATTDDKVVLGYSSEGLPFQIIVDSTPYGKESTNPFIDQHVVPLLERYIRELKKVPHPESTDFNHKAPANLVTKKFIKEIHGLMQKHAPHADFAMTMAVQYHIGNQTFCAGFGIGDTSLAMKRADGSVEQLVAATQVKETGDEEFFRDSFDHRLTAKKLDAVIARNTVFSTAVNSGDELVGYTYVFDDLRGKAEEKTLAHNPSRSASTKTRSFPLRRLQQILDPKTTLFQGITTLNENQHQAVLEKALNAQDGKGMGNDTSFVQSIVPNAENQKLIQQKQYDYLYFELRNSIERIQNSKLKAKAEAVFSAVASNEFGLSLPERNEVLTETYYLLHAPSKCRKDRASEYKKYADEVSGRPSIACRVLGGLLAALAIAAAATVFTLISVGTFGIGSAPAIALMAVGGASLLGSLGLFTWGRRKGLSKDMVAVAEYAEKQEMKEELLQPLEPVIPR